MYLRFLCDSHNTWDYFLTGIYQTDCSNGERICLIHCWNLIFKFTLNSAYKWLRTVPSTPIPDREKQKNEYNRKEGIHSDRSFHSGYSLGLSPKHSWPNSSQFRENVTFVYCKGQFIVVFTIYTIYSSHDVTSDASCAKCGCIHLQRSYLSTSYFKLSLLSYSQNQIWRRRTWNLRQRITPPHNMPVTGLFIEASHGFPNSPRIHQLHTKSYSYSSFVFSSVVCC